MTRSREEEIEARLAAATPGDWRLCHHLQSAEKDASCPCGFPGDIWSSDGNHVVCSIGPHCLPADQNLGPPRYERAQELANAALIAHTHSDLTFLLSQVRGLRKHVEALEKERAERETLVECIKVIGKALRTLRNETRGTLRAHELAIRYDHGNSNWRCLEIALEMADAALGEPTPASKEGA